MKNRQQTTYQGRSYLQDGYRSDFAANIQNSEGTFVFQSNTELDANTSGKSNGEIEGTRELNINAAAWKSNPNLQFQDNLK